MRMTQNKWILAVFAMTIFSVTAAGANDAGTAPTVAEQIAGMQAMCAETVDARAQRHAEKPLYDRLGGYDRIHELAREIVHLHSQNEAIKGMFEYLDREELAKRSADFIASGTGGSQSYSGPTLPETHAKLRLTDADFLAAGGDILKAMQTMGYGENEINEFVCILVSLKDQVVLK
jgi:hemoglobin